MKWQLKWLVLGAALAAALPIRADVIVIMDTTPLKNLGGTWYLDFQLANDNPSTNTAVISSINLGGGTHQTPDQFPQGGVSGSFPSYTLTDGGGANPAEAIIPFLAGASVTFQLGDTNNFTAGFNPDTFSWAVDDSNFNPIVSAGLGASLVILADGTSNNISTFAADSTFGGIIPMIRPVVSGVPEPGTAGLAGACLGGFVLTLAGLKFRRRLQPALRERVQILRRGVSSLL